MEYNKKSLIPVRGIIMRIHSDSLCYVEFEPNEAGKKNGVLVYSACERFPERSTEDMRYAESVIERFGRTVATFRLRDVVEGYIDTAATGQDFILQAKVSDPELFQKPHISRKKSPSP